MYTYVDLLLGLVSTFFGAVDVWTGLGGRTGATSAVDCTSQMHKGIPHVQFGLPTPTLCVISEFDGELISSFETESVTELTTDLRK